MKVFDKEVKFVHNPEDCKPGDVKSYFLPLEEVHAKYGKPNLVKRRTDKNTFVLNLVRKDKKEEGENE